MGKTIKLSAEETRHLQMILEVRMEQVRMVEGAFGIEVEKDRGQHAHTKSILAKLSENGRGQVSPGVFRTYRRVQNAELRPYVLGERMDRISVSPADLDAGSPKEGDMIARNPDNHDDQWLVAKAYFEKNFELLEDE